jgi:hypothetical protein
LKIIDDTRIPERLLKIKSTLPEGHLYTMTRKRSKEGRYQFLVTIDTDVTNPYDEIGFKLVQEKVTEAINKVLNQ